MPVPATIWSTLKRVAANASKYPSTLPHNAGEGAEDRRVRGKRNDNGGKRARGHHAFEPDVDDARTFRDHAAERCIDERRRFDQREHDERDKLHVTPGLLRRAWRRSAVPLGPK